MIKAKAAMFDAGSPMLAGKLADESFAAYVEAYLRRSLPFEQARVKRVISDHFDRLEPPGCARL